MARFHRLLRHAQPLDAMTPRVWVVDAAISPLLWAFLGRARIVVPKVLFNLLSDAEFEAVLCHERAHFRRRDHWVRWVEFAVMTALWWHPMVWWISRHLRAAEEVCCDADVVADLPDRQEHKARMTAGTHTIGGSIADRQRAAAELLKTWPDVMEDELKPLLKKPTALPLPDPVDAPRQEPLPSETTPLKKLPG